MLMERKVEEKETVKGEEGEESVKIGVIEVMRRMVEKGRS